MKQDLFKVTEQSGSLRGAHFPRRFFKTRDGKGKSGRGEGLHFRAAALGAKSRHCAGRGEIARLGEQLVPGAITKGGSPEEEKEASKGRHLIHREAKQKIEIQLRNILTLRRRETIWWCPTENWKKKEKESKRQETRGGTKIGRLKALRSKLREGV